MQANKVFLQELKMESFMTTEKESWNIKLIDLGFDKFFKPPELTLNSNIMP